ncbi:MAG: C-terminal binding protein [Lachnoclostridium edouardi]|uniref:C-terminal binding protein n=1 Tax=Lachnoclostridium edouardi TaxID=1926283 RepID=UPI0026DBE667|nr:C-terminal binding protein [Lachnoclostridium edouardi]MDO4278256.1 C-terminal binding protein [Lachnoclostridium edouardi]
MYIFGIADPHTLGENEFILEKQLLEGTGIELRTYSCYSEEDVIKQMAECDYCGVVSVPFTRRVIENLPKCKGIFRYGIGVDNIDLQAASENGIAMCYEPKYCVEDVAALGFALLLGLSRKTVLLDRNIRKGLWGFKAGYESHRLQGKVLGLLGFGNIGKRLREMVKIFDMQVIAYDPFLSDQEAQQYHINKVKLNQLLEQSDFLSVHCPLTEETRHMLSEEQFKIMKPTAHLINTSRGGIVDTQALVEALRNKEICGAALDVHEKEPVPADHPLCQMEQVILTPHSGFYTEEAFITLRENIVKQVAALSKEEKPIYIINPQVLENRNHKAL